MSQGIKENPQTDEIISFGPFRLYAAQRLIEREGVPLHLGGRALDILIVLVEHAGEVVSKNDLMARVWPGVTVDEGSLRVHVAALRKALGDGESGARYLTTLNGAGLLFRGAGLAFECAKTLGDGGLEARASPQSSDPPDTNGRARPDRSGNIGATEGRTLRHHRGTGWHRQDHRCGLGRL